VLTHEHGFHARPSIMLTQLAKRFSAKVWIGLSDNGPWTDAKSIARVMALKAPRQTMVFFAAEGTDATDAVSALVRWYRATLRKISENRCLAPRQLPTCAGFRLHRALRAARWCAWRRGCGPDASTGKRAE